MKKNQNIKFVIICLAVGSAFLIGLFYFVLFLTSFSFPTPLKPEIKKTEIDFTLTYEINGEKKYYSDSLVCKFDGIEVTSAGKSRKWKGWYKSKPDDNRIELYNIDDVYCITLGVGTPEYFLSDPNVEYVPENPYIAIFNRSTGYYITGTQEEREILKKVGFRVIDWKCEQPIENIYE